MEDTTSTDVRRAVSLSAKDVLYLTSDAKDPEQECRLNLFEDSIDVRRAVSLSAKDVLDLTSDVEDPEHECRLNLFEDSIDVRRAVSLSAKDILYLTSDAAEDPEQECRLNLFEDSIDVRRAVSLSAKDVLDLTSDAEDPEQECRLNLFEDSIGMKSEGVTMVLDHEAGKSKEINKEDDDLEKKNQFDEVTTKEMIDEILTTADDVVTRPSDPSQLSDLHRRSTNFSLPRRPGAVAVGASFRIQQTGDDVSMLTEEESHTVVASELAPDQQELMANFEEAQADRESLQRRLERMEEQRPVANAVLIKDDGNGRSSSRKHVVVLLVCSVLFITAIVIGAIVGTTRGKNNDERSATVSTTSTTESPTLSPMSSNTSPSYTASTPAPTLVPFSGPTLQYVKEKGNINCRAESFEVKQGFGFSLDLCRAISAAIFGDSSLAQFPYVPFSEQFAALYDRSLDLSTTQTASNMARDVYQKSTGLGFSFSNPYFYSGTTFAGVPEMVDCANRQDTINGLCRGLQVCVLENTVTEQLVNSLLSGTATVPTIDSTTLIENFAQGICNVIAGAPLLIFEQRVRDLNYTGEYELGGRLFSKEPLAMVSRGDDDEWADFVNWVLNALIAAEAMNITQDRANEFPTTDLFGGDYTDMFRNAIAAVGNYGELYARHYEARAPRSGLNRINHGGSGLMYSKPFGGINNILMVPGRDPGPIVNGTLETISNRGLLRCGIIANRTGFAEFDSSANEWSGVDIDYCLAISATIFPGLDPTESILFVDHSTLQDGYASLGTNMVDVLAGGTFSMESDIRERATGAGFDFSVPYFYDDDKDVVMALASQQGDPQWSDFLRWAVYATIYAEEENVTQTSAQEMPIVEVFGLKYLQMFRDVIVTIGNYPEIYDRNLQAHIPRSGRNQLNDNDGPQLFPWNFA